jgi:hypothetical protein
MSNLLLVAEDVESGSIIVCEENAQFGLFLDQLIAQLRRAVSILIDLVPKTIYVWSFI